jgi:hypothetical protein
MQVVCYLRLWTIIVGPTVIISVGNGNFKQAGIVGGSEQDKETILLFAASMGMGLLQVAARLSTIAPACSCQGNRVKQSCGDETCEELIVPCGHFAFEAEAVFAGSFSDEVEGDVLDGEIGGCVIGSEAATLWTDRCIFEAVAVLLGGENLDIWRSEP